MPVLLFIMFAVIPFRASAAVRITELSWMGVAGLNGQYGEWIELYNDGESAVNLSGWKLYGDGGGQLIYTFSKTIAAGGYYVAERTTTSMPDPVPGIDDEHGAFGGGGFANTGEDLVLKDADGTAVQSLNFAAGWPAGDASTKETMQWNGATWITAEATPKAQAAAIADTGSGDVTEDDVDDTETSEDNEVETPNVPKVVMKSKVKKVVAKPEPHIELSIPRIISIHVPYSFSPTVYTKDDTNPSRGVYRWNFGDGSSVETGKAVPVSHTYLYPGIYTIWFGYYDTIFDEDPILFVQTEASVQEPDISVSVFDGNALRIQNNGGTQVDLSNWAVQSAGRSAQLPKMTMLAPHATIVIHASTLGIPISESVHLNAPDGTAIESGEVLGEVTEVESIDAIAPEEPLLAEPAPVQETFSAPESFIEQPQAKKAISAKAWLLGAAALTVLALFILLARFMAKRE